LLLINHGENTTHPRSNFQKGNFSEEDLLSNFQSETGLKLLVISLEPIYQGTITIKSETPNLKRTIFYYAGIVDNHQEAHLKSDQSEYLWVDHLGGRNAISVSSDIEAYEAARNWLYDHDEAALFLANNIQKML
jgi:hypothetical protein